MYLCMHCIHLIDNMCTLHTHLHTGWYVYICISHTHAKGEQTSNHCTLLPIREAMSLFLDTSSFCPFVLKNNSIYFHG